MGNEQSGSAIASEGGGGSSILERVKGGVGAATGGTRKVNTEKIIVVRSASELPKFDPAEDECIKKLAEIPPFYPVLRSLLNLPGVKDPIDLHSKFSARPLALMAGRLEEHLALTSRTVASEQQAICSRVKEVEYILAHACTQMNERKKAYEKFELTLAKVRDIQTQLRKINTSIEQMVPQIDTVNQWLPPEHRLPSLDLSPICDQMLLTAMARPLALDSPELDTSAAVSSSEEGDPAVEEQTVVDVSS